MASLEEEGGGLPLLSHHRPRVFSTSACWHRGCPYGQEQPLGKPEGCSEETLTAWHSPGRGIHALCLQGRVGAADGFPGRVFLFNH